VSLTAEPQCNTQCAQMCQYMMYDLGSCVTSCGCDPAKFKAKKPKAAPLGLIEVPAPAGTEGAAWNYALIYDLVGIALIVAFAAVYTYLKVKKIATKEKKETKKLTKEKLAEPSDEGHNDLEKDTFAVEGTYEKVV